MSLINNDDNHDAITEDSKVSVPVVPVEPEARQEDKSTGLANKEETEILNNNTDSQVAETTSSKTQDSKQTYYLIKWITFNQTSLPIILQNENGPCPLIAICNCLLLKEFMKLTSNQEQINSIELMHKLADCLFNTFIPRWSNAHSSSNNKNEFNLEKNIDETLRSFERLRFGIDVNVKFTGVRDFEYTSELDLFDIFDVNLYHGWLIDPQQAELHKYLADKSYNKLVDILLSEEPNTDDQIALVRLQSQNFLESTSSQLSYYGLSELYAQMKKNELAILFRNNHFSTIYKNPHDDKLFILCTDQGYLNHKQIIWELLDNIDGAGEFYDCYFKPINNTSSTNGLNKIEIENNLQDECQNDYLLALSLQQNENEQQEQDSTNSNQAQLNSDKIQTSSCLNSNQIKSSKVVNNSAHQASSTNDDNKKNDKKSDKEKDSCNIL